MPRIAPPRPPRSARIEQPAPPPPAGTRTRASRSTAADTFTAEVSPRPLPVESYKATHFGAFNYGAMSFAPDIGTGGAQLPLVAEAGKPFVIDYGRVPDMIGLPGTLEKATLRYRIDGGPVQDVVVAEGENALAYGLRAPHRIDVPHGATGEIEYWFELRTTDGATHYDSNFGANYRANIVPAGGAILRFDDLWGETLSEPIKAGGTLRLAYDVDRILPSLRGTSHHGAATWGATAHVSFDGGPAVQVPLTAVRYGAYGSHASIEPVEAAIEIPNDAKSVSIWIEGRAYAGNAWDSDFGTNYTFSVQP